MTTPHQESEELVAHGAKGAVVGTTNTQTLTNKTLTAPNISQVVFPATQVASTNANTLDDYEEGTWTPSLTFGGAAVGMTYTTQLGRYTKIGNRVICTAQIALSAKGSSTGDVLVSGLPFVIQNDEGAYPAISLSMLTVTFADWPHGFGNLNASSIWLVETTNAGVRTRLNDTDFANTSSILLAITFEV